MKVMNRAIIYIQVWGGVRSLVSYSRKLVQPSALRPASISFKLSFVDGEALGYALYTMYTCSYGSHVTTPVPPLIISYLASPSDLKRNN